MAAPLCQRATGMVPSIANDIENKLTEIAAIFHQTKYMCVITTSGDLVTSRSTDDRPPQEILFTMCALRQAATKLASALDSYHCPILHISGDEYILSCYETGPCILAFYTISITEDITQDMLDMTEKDSQIADKIQELRLLVQNVMIPSSDPRS